MSRPYRNGSLKRLLMVAYYYPPVDEIGTPGSIRTEKFAKYLTRYGWYPTVLTVTPDKTQSRVRSRAEVKDEDIQVIHAFFLNLYSISKRLMSKFYRLPISNAERHIDIQTKGHTRNPLIKLADFFIRFAKEVATFPDVFLPWVPFAVTRGIWELRSRDYDAIYSTSSPVTDHIVASILHRLSGLPWLADFRDPWTQNEIVIQNTSSTRLCLEKKLERATLSRSSAILTISEPWARNLQVFHGDRPYGVRYIPSGFDQDDYPRDVSAIKGKFVITYTGTLYKFKRDPTVLLQAIEELIAEGIVKPNEIIVRFYGPYEQALFDLKESLHYPEIIEIYGVVSHKESIIKQCESAATLIVQWDHPYTRDVYGGKIFEYLGTQRPIIALTHSNGVLGELIEKAHIGYAGRDKNQLKQVLTNWLQEFRINRHVSLSSCDEIIKEHQWDILTGSLASLLDEMAYSDQPNNHHLTG